MISFLLNIFLSPIFNHNHNTIPLIINQVRTWINSTLNPIKPEIKIKIILKIFIINNKRVLKIKNFNLIKKSVFNGKVIPANIAILTNPVQALSIINLDPFTKIIFPVTKKPKYDPVINAKNEL